MLVILGIGVLLNYLRELSNMGINDFEREFFSDKNINNVYLIFFSFIIKYSKKRIWSAK